MSRNVAIPSRKRERKTTHLRKTERTRTPLTFEFYHGTFLRKIPKRGVFIIVFRMVRSALYPCLANGTYGLMECDVTNFLAHQWG